MTFRIFYTFLIFALLLSSGVSSALATDNLEDSLLAATDEELTDEERLVRATDSLTKALSLSLEKVTRLTEELEEREFEDGSTERILQEQYLGELQEYDSYYTEQLEVLVGLETLEEIQNLAKAVKEYRDMVYTPRIEIIVEFALVFYGEEVVDIATLRFEKVSTDIDELRVLGFIKEDAFIEDLENVDSLIEEAGFLQSDARAMLLAAFSNNVSSTTEDILVEEVSTSTVEEVPVPGATSTDIGIIEATTTDGIPELATIAPRDLLEAGLNNIKEAYTIFVDISNAVQETLGIE